MAVSNVTLPNGERVNISHEDDASELDVLNFAYKEYVTNTDPGSAFGRGIRDGVDILQKSYGSTLEGIGSILDADSLRQVGADVVAQQQGEMDAERFRQQRYGDQDEGIVDYTLNLAGTSLPQMGPAAAGAVAGGIAGAGFLGIGAVPGALLGGLLGAQPYFYGDNRERQKEAIERGFRTEIDERAAFLYSIPQAALDSAFGFLGAKFLATPALKAGGGLLTRATRGAVEGAIIEAPTELGQQFLNRYQAGLPIDSDEAKLEYIEAAKGGALLGGLFGGGGRAVFGSKEGADAMPEPAAEETVQVPSVTTPEGEAVSPEVEEILEGQPEPETSETPITDEEIKRAINTADTLEEQFPGQDSIRQEQMDQYRSDLENKKRVMQELDAAIQPDQQAFDESLVNRPPPVEQDSMPTFTEEQLEARSIPDPLSPDATSAEVAEAVEGMLTAQEEAALEAEMQRELSGDIIPEGPVPVDPVVEDVDDQPQSIVESAPVTAPPQEVDSEAVKEQQDTIDDADYNIANLQSEIEVEKSNIKEARAKNKQEIAAVRKSKLSKEDKADKIEDLKASLQDEVDDINGNIGIYKEEMSSFKKDLRKAKTELDKLNTPAQEAPKKNIKITAKVLSNLRKTAVQIAGAVGSRTKVELTTFYSKDEDRSVTFDAVNNEGQFDIVDGNEIKGKELPVGTVVDARINKYEGGDFELFDSRELRLKEDGTWEEVKDIASLREAASAPAQEAALEPEGALTEEELVYILGQMDGDLTVGADPRIIPFTDKEAFVALPSNQKAKHLLHRKNPIKKGAVRLNLNSKFYKKDGVVTKYTAEQEKAGIPKQEGAVGPLYVQTLHRINRAGVPEHTKAYSYGRAFTIRNATFSVNPFAKTIIRSKAKNKYPMASVDGDIVADVEPNLEGEVLSFNPFMHDSFVDSQGRRVVGADEITVYGTKAYARGNIQYSDTAPEVVTASEILSLARLGKKYVHPNFHPQGIDLSKLSSAEIEKLEALADQEGRDVTVGADSESVEYNLLNSPFILEYSGRGPQDTSIPNYNSFHYVVSNAQQQALNSAIQSGAVDALADEMVNETTEMMKDPEVSAGMGWYGRMRTRLSQIFGADRDLFTHLLGTTSAQTAVEQNFRYSVNLYNRFKAGEFDPQIKRYLALRGRLQAGTLGDLLIQSKVTNSKGVVYTKELIKKSQPSALLQNAARHFNLLPTQPDGQLFGANSYPALKALSQVWFADRLGKNRMTPKTPQFAMNLNGQSLEATIDVWAARSLRRIIYRGRKEARIVPKEETAVSNPDFALGQLIFARAAKKLNMNPDDLQAVVWFGEKKIWDQNGWTGAAGALKSSFDEPAEVFYPSDGTTRSEADANLILDFLATERLVKRDIAFPTAIKPTSQSNNRKKYDEYLRRSIISDFLQSRGRGAVYEGESVESDRRRQVTRAINRLRGFGGKVRYRKGTGKEPKRSLGVIERGSVLSGKQFSAIAKRNQRGNKFGSSVDVLSEAKYKGYDLIVIESGPGANVTLSISPDGEVGSVTKSTKATSLDVAAAFDMAISTGKVKFLNGFETVLPDKYANHGFVPVARLKFDPSQKPPGWSTQTYKKYNNGEPDVIFMRLGGRIGGTYDPTGFPTVNTYEEGVALASQDVTAGTDTGPEIADIINEGKTFENAGQLDRFISKVFTPIARKLGVDIIPNYSIGRALQYNVTQGVIEYNPVGIINNTREYLTAGMREELIHAAMHKVLINQNKGKTKVAAWVDFMTKLGKDLTPEQRQALSDVYRNLGDDMEFGAEYSRAVIQQALYGDITEVYAKGKSFEKIKKLFRSIQGFVARTFGSEVSNPEVAGVIRASADLLKAVDPSVRPSNQVIVGAAMENSVDMNPNSEITSQDVVEAGKPPSKRKIDLNFADKYLFTVSSVLGKIHPRLKLLIRDYYGLIQSKVLSYQTAMAPFFKKMRAIKNKADRRRLKQLLMYSPMVADEGTAEQEALLAKYGMLEDYNNLVRPALKKLRADLEARGVLIGDLFDYFPRRIKNFKALQAVKAYWGKTVGASFESFITARNEAIMEVRRDMMDKNQELVTASNNNDQAEVQRISRELKALSAKDDVIITIGSKETALQEAQEWDKFITKFSENNPDMLPGNARERAMKGQIPDELLQYYEDPAPAMESYIFNMVSATETVKLIGNRFVTNQQGTELEQASKLGRLVQELRASGAIIDQQADHTIPEIMKLILSPKKGESRILQLARSFGYGTLLVEFTSTLSQLYDLPFVMLDNGFFPTLNAMFGKRLKGSAFGIDTEKISQEFAGDDKFLEKAVRLGLRSTGFTKLDQIMKETNLTANYRRYRKLANLYYRNRDSSKIKTFTAEMTSMGYSPEEQNQLIADLKKGDQDSALIRSLLFNKLAETQPLSSAEMAMGIVGNPNLRIAVAMKSFMVKQMVFTKDRMLNDMFGRGKTKAQRLKASKDLTKLLAFMLLIGVPADALKDFLAGRVGYLDDYLFDGVFRIAGVSRYTGYKIRSEGIGRAAFDYATPVAFQQAMDATGELQKVMSGERAFTQSKFVAYAPYSDVINRMFGFQKVKERKTVKRKASEGEFPLFIPPGAL